MFMLNLLSKSSSRLGGMSKLGMSGTLGGIPLARMYSVTWMEERLQNELKKIISFFFFPCCCMTCLGISWSTALARASLALGASSSWLKSEGSRLPRGRKEFRSVQQL